MNSKFGKLNLRKDCNYIVLFLRNSVIIRYEWVMNVSSYLSYVPPTH